MTRQYYARHAPAASVFVIAGGRAVVPGVWLWSIVLSFSNAHCVLTHPNSRRRSVQGENGELSVLH